MLKDKILSIAVLAVSLVACTSDDTLLSQSVAPSAEGLPFCAVISTGAGARTRVITENTTDGTLMTAWELNDEVALIHDNLVDIMKVDSIDDVTGDVVITGTITGTPADSADVTLVYPASAVDETTKAVKADLLAAQDGELPTISKKLDLRQSKDAMLAVGLNIVTLLDSVTMDNQLAVVKFMLTDGTDSLKATSFVIANGKDSVLTTVTPAETTGASHFYVAMRPDSAATYHFSATVGGQNWMYAKTGVQLKAGTYYQSPIAMTATKIDVDSIGLDQTSVPLVAGDSITLTATVGPADATYKTVTWKSDKPEYATVDENGKVKAISAGTAVITCTATNGTADTSDDQEATCTVTVTAPPTVVPPSGGYTDGEDPTDTGGGISVGG